AEHGLVTVQLCTNRTPCRGTCGLGTDPELQRFHLALEPVPERSSALAACLDRLQVGVLVARRQLAQNRRNILGREKCPAILVALLVRCLARPGLDRPPCRRAIF